MKNAVDTAHLAALGTGSGTQYQYSEPQASLLETFDNPSSIDALNPNDASMEITIEAPEFTSLCPKTGQPDFATIVVEYTPNLLCVESKSFKLYLNSFRNHGEFHESCVNRICNDLVELMDPSFLRVTGQFSPRGGIKFWPVAEYFKPIPELGAQ